MMLLRQTDLPEPVAPATRRCGALARSKMTSSPSMARPRMTGRRALEAEKAGEASEVRARTVSETRLGTSKPT